MTSPAEPWRWQDGLLTASGVTTFWCLYGVSHASLRFVLSSTLSLDDGRENEILQSLSLGYQLRQPPLYEWLLWIVQQIVGTGLISHLLIRYVLIASLGVATFIATHTISRDNRWSAAASLSLILSYPVGWQFHEWATQTLLLSIACLLTLAAVIRFLDRPAWIAATFIGLAAGLGLMSKFSFLLFLGGMILAIVSIPATRARLADARLLLAAAIAVAMVSPYIWWLIAVRGDLVNMASERLTSSNQSHIVRSAIGLLRLAWSLPAFLMPWLAFVAVAAWPAFRPSGKSRAPAPLPERIVLRGMLFAAVLMAIGVLGFGANNIGERYMHPILITAPAYVFARIARIAPYEPHLRRLIGLVMIVMLVLFSIRVLAFTQNPLSRMARAESQPFVIPFEGLARALKQRGIVDGTVVSPSARQAGNLRAFLPGLRGIAGDTSRFERPPRRASDARSCVMVWNEKESDFARRISPTAASAGERIEVAVPVIFRGIRSGVWFLARLDPSTPACL